MCTYVNKYTTPTIHTPVYAYKIEDFYNILYIASNYGQVIKLVTGCPSSIITDKIKIASVITSDFKLHYVPKSYISSYQLCSTTCVAIG